MTTPIPFVPTCSSGKQGRGHLIPTKTLSLESNLCFRNPREHEGPVVATGSHPLNKSLNGFRGLFEPEGVALLITNEYKTLKWSDNEPMILRGAARDRMHIQGFLEHFGSTLGVEVVPIENALRKDIEDQIRKVVAGCPPLLVMYFQGHGVPTSDHSTVQYITGDHRMDGVLEGLAAEELIQMFSKLTARTMAVALTDFCHSGNLFRLRFELRIAPDGTGSWAETKEWREDSKDGREPRIASPMLHVAASLRPQLVYETERRGGYFTNALAHSKAENMTLTGFLSGLRRCVDGHLGDAKGHDRYPLPGDAAQTPQIFCSGTPPLDDPEVFPKFRLGEW